MGDAEPFAHEREGLVFPGGLFQQAGFGKEMTTLADGARQTGSWFHFGRSGEGVCRGGGRSARRRAGRIARLRGRVQFLRGSQEGGESQERGQQTGQGAGRKMADVQRGRAETQTRHGNGISERSSRITTVQSSRTAKGLRRSGNQRARKKLIVAGSGPQGTRSIQDRKDIALSYGGRLNRDRGSSHLLAPPTPPYRRVRIRRFSKLSPCGPEVRVVVRHKGFAVLQASVSASPSSESAELSRS